MTEMKGMENKSFQKCYEMASISEIEGIKVPFIHLNHLIANKKAVNRLKDQFDVIQLEKIKEIRENPIDLNR